MDTFPAVDHGLSHLTRGEMHLPVHPKGSKARVLLTSVFGPYAQDDEFGSRSLNPMELYHNQVTRAQGAFSLRMFHRSWGIMMIQHNISAPCTVLDFPTREIFEQELRSQPYDVIGISAIVMNFGKVREMCRMARVLAPQAVTVVGGHVTAVPGIEQLIDADHIARGEGIVWMRRYLGEDTSAPIHHPSIVSGFGARIMGLKARGKPGSTAATIIPSVGCPMGCNFCSTSAFFGGKGRFANFYERGDQLFQVMCQAEQELGVRSFFVMDENFLLFRKRALELLRCMQQYGKSWALYVFSSAHALRKYTMEELVALGVSWVWMGLESSRALYEKLRGTDTLALARELHSHGIKVLGSTIIGLEHHTPANIEQEVAQAIAHGTDFHQFMLYTPTPGTPLHEQMQREGRLLPDVDLADIHGQDRFNFAHPAISREDSKTFLDWAFRRDFECNGPSLYRICQTTLAGWKRYKRHPDSRIRRRFEWEARQLHSVLAGLLWAMGRHLRSRNPAVSGKIRQLRQEIAREFGVLKTSLFTALLGPVAFWAHRREERRLARGVRYEPQPILERRNW